MQFNEKDVHVEKRKKNFLKETVDEWLVGVEAYLVMNITELFLII